MLQILENILVTTESWKTMRQNRVNSLDLCNNVKGCLDGSMVKYILGSPCLIVVRYNY